MNDTVVMSYIISRWIGWLVISILLSIIFIIFSSIAHIKKFRSWILILFVLLTLYTSIPTITGIMDIKQQSYITEQVIYSRSDPSKTRNNSIASESIQITASDRHTVILKGATRQFPYGEFTGTITYAKRSKIVISFIPD